MKLTTENNRYRMFSVSYSGPTESGRGSRVIIRDMRHGKTKVIPYRYDMNRIGDMAEEYLEKCLGISCDGLAMTKSGPDFILSKDFSTPLK
jgi:hypothetical protein